jgi:hypothetical protein
MKKFEEEHKEEMRRRNSIAAALAEEEAIAGRAAAMAAAAVNRPVIVISSDDDSDEPIIILQRGADVGMDVTLRSSVEGKSGGAVDIRVAPGVSGFRLRVRASSNENECPFVRLAGGMKNVRAMSKKERNDKIFTPRLRAKQLRQLSLWKLGDDGDAVFNPVDDEEDEGEGDEDEAYDASCRDDKEKKDDDEEGGAGGAGNAKRVERLMKRNAAKEFQGSSKKGKVGTSAGC